MKDNFIAIILSVVIIFLLGTLGFAFAFGQGVNVNVASNPQNNADGGSPQVSNPATQDSGQSIGAAQRPDVVITKYLDYDDITTTGVAITNPVTGSFVVDNVYIETGANTMASGTLFQVYSSGNTFATSTTVFSTQVSNFPKATGMNLDTLVSASGVGTGFASSTQRVVLDDGGQLYAKCTAASCKLSQVESEIGTAGKNLRVTVILKPTDSGSSIYE